MIDVNLLFIAGLAALFVLLVYMALAQAAARRSRRNAVMARMNPDAGPGAQDLRATGTWLKAAFSQAAASLGEKISPKKSEETSKQRLDLIRAGYRGQNAVSLFWGIKAGMAMVFFGLAVLAANTVGERLDDNQRLAIMLGAPTLGLYLPSLLLARRIAKRQTAVAHAMPDALDLLVVCVEAGMGLDAAITRVCREIAVPHPIFSNELKVLTQELKAGKLRREALKNLGRRVGLEDLNSLTAMLIQSDMFGTSVATTLRIYSDAMRTKRFQKAEEMAAKLPVKLLFPLVFFILPPLFIVIIGPGAIRMMGMFSTMGGGG